MAPELAEAFPPGDFLTEELEARHWSQGDFAQILGRPAQFVSEIISGKKEITRESAAQIGAAQLQGNVECHRCVRSETGLLVLQPAG